MKKRPPCTGLVKLNCRRRISSFSRSKRSIVVAVVVSVIGLILYLHYFVGTFYKLYEKDFCSEFAYPLDISDFPQFIEDHKAMDKLSKFTGGIALPTPINQEYSKIRFLQYADEGCPGPFGFLIIVKSATGNFEKRETVRSTWGDISNLQKTQISSHLPTKLVFITGTLVNGSSAEPDRERLVHESQLYADIITADFLDTYDNNTHKSISALRWANNFCNNFRYLLLVDDDMYISLKNIAMYFKNPSDYENKFKSLLIQNHFVDPASLAEPTSKNHKPEGFYKEKLFFGKVLLKPHPMRNQYGLNSKWFVSLEDYPYNLYPPYITGMATILSKSCVEDFVYATLFTRPFHIDDVYMGILAYKLKIQPVHTDYFCLGKSWRNQTGSLEYMMAIHDFTPAQLYQVWDNVTRTDYNL